MSNYKVTVGSDSYRPWENYTRESLEYSCIEMGMSSENLDQYSNEELFKKLISLGCAKSAMEEEE
ncbi:hypothetical protein VPIG_00093 [Vibrio phage PWH3a-P1]|uniref:hypothetical protein n=1 Tax=Vibrio phage PWH3a-P1 TaxID=754058 RepID=UPI0002C134D1|nr:hypothetical protein VPIG_00093 [Vibrio phage PWH3a-P1]AGH31951.1 hypothetical protein VPIG_00093 [Vibrio phage PWH3a-P1]